MNYSKSIRKKVIAERVLISWAIVLVVGITIGCIITAAIKANKHEGKKEAQKVVNETLIYGRDGKATEVKIEGWETSKEKFKKLDIPLEEKLQEYTFYLCDAFDLDYSLGLGVMKTESNFRTNVVSNTGDHGIMQINEINLPELKKKLDITNLNDPYQSIYAGFYLLRQKFDKYKNTNQALMAYNMGDHGASVLFKRGIYETEYTKKVLKNQAEIKKELER